MPFVLVSSAGDIVIECRQNGGGSEKYTTHGKNTAADGYGRGLKVECVLFVYECIFCIAGEVRVECSCQ
jgi:hypothetical protein